MARYEIIVGCMFSGKSTELLRRVGRYSAIGKKVLVVNSSLDSRGEGTQTHSGTRTPATKVRNLMDLVDTQEYIDSEVIAVDEAQFFGDLVEFHNKCVDDNGKILIVAGLDGTSEREPFGQIHMTLCKCDSIVKLNAMDMITKDGTLAIFSKRISETWRTIDIGGTDKYIAVSRSNYLKY
uniref:thymidine kinase n=1 Tax=viral metagenome TaxID=1070528 RepID=A0A6C0KAD8_9ZZZZ